MRSIGLLVPALALAPLLSLTLAACGGADTPGQKAANERHENFEEIGDSFKTITDELKKTAPDVAKIREGAARINGFAPQVRDWFPAGSGPQDGVKTDALATIWEQPDAFQQAAARLADEAAAMNTAAEAGDLAAVRGAVLGLGGACKNCHDRFREED
jgi:cytochrome c556